MKRKLIITISAFTLGFVVFRYVAKFELNESLLISFGATVLSFVIPKKFEKNNKNFTKK
ncbi:hypothetical protein [Chryseobacterium indoltheticum]|uniref:hypothetical protein n=1 Tax=Chryseobacterium indoltheticum TaxID=254 RepID=UPI0040420800